MKEKGRREGERGRGGGGGRERVEHVNCKQLLCVQHACVRVFTSEKADNEMVCFIILQTQ